MAQKKRYNLSGGTGYIFPTFSLSIDTNDLTRGDPICTLIGTFTKTPADAVLTLIDDDGGKFKLINDELHAGPVATDDLDGAWQNCTVRLSWGGKFLDYPFRVNIADFAVTEIDIDNDTSDHTDTAGTLIGNLSVQPDPGARAVVYAIDDADSGHFAIVGDALNVGTGGNTAGTYDLQISVTVDGADNGTFPITITVT